MMHKAYKKHRRGALLFFKIIRQMWRSHRTKKKSTMTRTERFRIKTPVSIHRWFCNGAHILKWHRKVPCCCSRSFVKVHGWLCSATRNFWGHGRGFPLFFIRLISRSHGPKNRKFESYLIKITRPVAAIKFLRFALLSWYSHINPHVIIDNK